MNRRAFLVLPLVAPGLARAQSPAGDLRVVASFSILGDMVRTVAGERALALRVLVGPNADAHDHQPRPSDAAAVREAGVLVRNGLGFDPWMDRLARSADFRGREVVATEGIEPILVEGGHHHGHSHGHTHGRGASRRAPDPHAWGDPRLGARYLSNIAEGLAEADPAGAGAYRASAEAGGARLRALDAELREAFAAVPEARRVVVTSHDAFAYLGAAYGVRFLAPQGVSTATDPSAAAVGRLIRRIREERITAVFVENMANPATLQRLAREAGVRVRGRLYADALSGPEGPAATYEAMLRHNAGLLVSAMRGEEG